MSSAKPCLTVSQWHILGSGLQTEERDKEASPCECPKCRILTPYEVSTVFLLHGGYFPTLPDPRATHSSTLEVCIHC